MTGIQPHAELLGLIAFGVLMAVMVVFHRVRNIQLAWRIVSEAANPKPARPEQDWLADQPAEVLPRARCPRPRPAGSRS